MRKLEAFILLVILLGGFLVRLYRFNSPVADWHSWRQADTSSVSRNFVNDGFNLLYPKFDDLSNVPSGIYDNPKGYRFVEFPIYNVLQAGSFILFGHFTLEEWGRLVSIFSSLLAAFFLYLICKKHSNISVALFAAFFYLFLPFNIFYSRTILPDQTVITLTLSGIYFFDRWLAEDRRRIIKYLFFCLCVISFSLSLLLKPFAGFFFLPVLVLAFEKWGTELFKKVSMWTIAFLSILPFFLWRIWILQYPEGIPQSGWLFNSGNIRFTGAFFHWIFAKRIGELILGYWGLPILVMGILVKNKRSLFFFSFLASAVIYIFVVARGNVQHSYYQIPIIPAIAIFMALGSSFFINPPKAYISKLISYPIFLVCLIFTLAFSWFGVRDYFNINNPSIIVAGQAVDRLVPKNAKVLAPYEGDTSFLYQTKRKGWASFEKGLPEMIKLGADYLVLVNPKKEDYDIGKTYKIIASSKDYIIFDLHIKP